jgi:hypothetical protein
VEASEDRKRIGRLESLPHMPVAKLSLQPIGAVVDLGSWVLSAAICAICAICALHIDKDERIWKLAPRWVVPQATR